ncbi:hypothetical protein HanRHA438_Chr01g0034961 [Helianthus annuus]|nr:hypothetical protein HanHA89_Chr01g0029951 [Helianthus annuus]KAJ0949097.1 hypothetical protein HanRHA438_Chr01g0034961 [Helianthus annuus]
MKQKLIKNQVKQAALVSTREYSCHVQVTRFSGRVLCQISGFFRKHNTLTPLSKTKHCKKHYTTNIREQKDMICSKDQSNQHSIPFLYSNLSS